MPDEKKLGAVDQPAKKPKPKSKPSGFSQMKLFPIRDTPIMTSSMPMSTGMAPAMRPKPPISGDIGGPKSGSWNGTSVVPDYADKEMDLGMYRPNPESRLADIPLPLPPPIESVAPNYLSYPRSVPMIQMSRPDLGPPPNLPKEMVLDKMIRLMQLRDEPMVNYLNRKPGE